MDKRYQVCLHTDTVILKYKKSYFKNIYTWFFSVHFCQKKRCFLITVFFMCVSLLTHSTDFPLHCDTVIFYVESVHNLPLYQTQGHNSDFHPSMALTMVSPPGWVCQTNVKQWNSIAADMPSYIFIETVDLLRAMN